MSLEGGTSEANYTSNELKLKLFSARYLNTFCDQINIVYLNWFGFLELT